MRAIAAVDVALWDIKAQDGRHAALSTCSAAPRATACMVYGHANGADIAETVDAVGRYIELGYKRDPRPVGRAGPDARLRRRPRRRSTTNRPRCGSADRDRLGHRASTCNFAPKLFEALRDAHGFEPHLLHDVHHRLTPIEAAQLGKALEPYRLFWLEDATPAENQEAFRLIRQHTTTPLAVGEVFNTIWDAKDLIQEQLIDYIRIDRRARRRHHASAPGRRLRRALQVRTGCHGATDLSPVTMGAALHFDTWVPNFGIQEYMRHSEETDAVFPHAYRFKDGFLHPGDAAGHGVDIDEALAAKYPYQRAYLPVARLEDGTMWNW